MTLNVLIENNSFQKMKNIVKNTLIFN